MRDAAPGLVMTHDAAVELLAINGRKHVTTLETIKNFEEELDTWKTSKVARHGGWDL